MRIALFCNDYWPTIGGVQTAVRGLAGALAGRGHQAVVLTRQPGACPPTDVVDGVPVHRFEWNLRPRATFLSRAWAARRNVRGAMLAWRPDAVYVHFVSAHALFAWDLARAARVPLLLSFRGNDIMRIGPRSLGTRRIYALLTRGADANLFCSSWLLTQAQRAPWFRGDPQRTGLLADAVSVEPRAAPASLPPQPFVLAAGRMVDKKGFDLLLRAWADLKDKIPARLVIAGDGEEREGLERLARDLALGDRVAFAGPMPHPAVLGLLERAALCVVPSREEPYGILVVEAQALGVPVVASAVGNIPALIRDRATGYLAEPS
ncbi:MAG TPA: glycosyltransferase family 4 protein, partial [Gemmatimonadales bacterium]|nr:glycosyltransferase family 4 protein [Gemmatimonadales bacterium]